MLVSVTLGNSRKSFHFVFLCISAVWIPFRVFIFWAAAQDLATWPEIIWLAPTTIQFAGFALWVLFFLALTRSEQQAAGRARQVVTLAAVTRSHLLAVPLVTDFATESVEGEEGLESEEDRGGGCCRSGCRLFLCCGCWLRRLRVSEWLYAWGTIVLGVINVVEIVLTLQQSATNVDFQDLVSLIQHVFNGLVHFLLAVPLFRLSCSLFRASSTGAMRTEHLPQPPLVLAALGTSLAIIFAAHFGYNAAVAIGGSTAALPPFPPLLWSHTLFLIGFEALPLSLALAVTCKPLQSIRLCRHTCRCCGSILCRFAEPKSATQRASINSSRKLSKNGALDDESSSVNSRMLSAEGVGTAVDAKAVGGHAEPSLPAGGRTPLATCTCLCCDTPACTRCCSLTGGSVCFVLDVMAGVWWVIAFLGGMCGAAVKRCRKSCRAAESPPPSVVVLTLDATHTEPASSVHGSELEPSRSCHRRWAFECCAAKCGCRCAWRGSTVLCGCADDPEVGTALGDRWEGQSVQSESATIPPAVGTGLFGHWRPTKGSVAGWGYPGEDDSGTAWRSNDTPTSETGGARPVAIQRARSGMDRPVAPSKLAPATASSVPMGSDARFLEPMESPVPPGYSAQEIQMAASPTLRAQEPLSPEHRMTLANAHHFIGDDWDEGGEGSAGDGTYAVFSPGAKQSARAAAALLNQRSNGMVVLDFDRESDDGSDATFEEQSPAGGLRTATGSVGGSPTTVATEEADLMGVGEMEARVATPTVEFGARVLPATMRSRP
jgi:hypothetical protein